MIEPIRASVPLVPLGTDYEGQNCGLARALELVGERWTLLIVRDLLFGVRRFSDLQARLDIPRAVLSMRLNALVENGLVERRPYASGRDELHPTAAAEALWPALHALMRWGDDQAPAEGGDRRLFTHAECGTDLPPTGRCPACEREPGPTEIITRSGPGRSAHPRQDRISLALREPHRLLTPVRGA
jgi:DNA-binding HxlR family transcriptional regulator